MFYSLLVVLSMTSLVAGASLAKQLFTSLGPESTSVIRLAIAAIFMTLFWKPWRQKIKWHQTKEIVLYGACLGLMNFTFYLAISRLPIGVAIAVEFLGPLSVAIFSSRKPIDFLWILFASIGIYLILPLGASNNPSSHLDPWGLFFALIAALCWALYILQGRRTAHAAPTAIAAPLGMFIGFICVLPLGYNNIPLVFTDWHLLLLASAVGLLSSAIPYSLEMVSLRHLATKHFSLLLSLEPAIGALGAYIFLSEVLSIQQITAIMLVITASIGSTITTKKETD